MADRGVGVRVTGARELRRAIKDAKNKELDEKLRKAHKNLADKVARRAKWEAPVLSGALQSSIRGLGSKSKAQVAAGKGRTRDYAGRIHYGDPVGGTIAGFFGVVKLEPQPFIHEALRVEWDDVIEYLVDLVEDIGDDLSTTKNR